ncbi:MAG: YbbR-like domain-containing protein [Bacteroidota bacterium]
MNQKLTKLLDRAKDPRDRDFRNHLYVFFICFGISLLIWFLIKMSDEYVSEIEIPVHYTNEPANKLLVESDPHITIRLRAKSGDMFSFKLFSGRKPVSVNLKQVELKKSRYFDRYYILTEHYLNKISENFDFSHDIISITPDTLFLEFEDIISRSLPVKAMISVECKAKFQIYDSIRVIPDGIMVSGPASIIDTLAYIPSRAMNFSDLDQTFETMLPLSLPVADDKISYSQSEVKLIIPVEKYTESTIEIPVSCLPVDTATVVRTFPETVQLTYQVAIRDYNLVNAGMFRLSVIYDSKKDREKKFLKVKVDESPEHIKITRIHPDRLEFLIQK